MQLRRPYRVVANRQVADRTWELVVNPEHGAPFDFLAGQFAWLDGPHGHFVAADPRPERMAFIAGGVGFAPVMGILRQLRAERWRGGMDRWANCRQRCSTPASTRWSGIG